MPVYFIPWLCTAATISFLAFSVQQNRKSGFQRSRPELSSLEETLIWFENLQHPFSPEVELQPVLEAPGAPPTAPISTAPMEEQSFAPQLFNLGQALGASTPPTPTSLSSHTPETATDRQSVVAEEQTR